MPELEPMGHHQHPLAHHNPWRDNDDPEEADISNWQMRPLGPHGFAVTATMHRTISPADYAPRGNGPNTVGGFASFLNSLIGGSQEAHQDQQNQNRAGHGMQGQGMPASGFGTTPGGHRFSYTAGARVVPQNSDHPGPHMEPVDELNK
jgi:E3 ubiquitin-protein ligase RNF115/126